MIGHADKIRCCQRCGASGKLTDVLLPLYRFVSLCDNCDFEWSKVMDEILELSRNFINGNQITMSTSKLRPGFVDVAKATTDAAGEITTSQLRETTGGNHDRI